MHYKDKFFLPVFAQTMMRPCPRSWPCKTWKCFFCNESSLLIGCHCPQRREKVSKDQKSLHKSIPSHHKPFTLLPAVLSSNVTPKGPRKQYIHVTLTSGFNKFKEGEGLDCWNAGEIAMVYQASMVARPIIMRKTLRETDGMHMMTRENWKIGGGYWWRGAWLSFFCEWFRFI